MCTGKGKCNLFLNNYLRNNISIQIQYTLCPLHLRMYLHLQWIHWDTREIACNFLCSQISIVSNWKLSFLFTYTFNLFQSFTSQISFLIVAQMQVQICVEGHVGSQCFKLNGIISTHVTYKGHLLLGSCWECFPSSRWKIRAEEGAGAQWVSTSAFANMKAKNWGFRA